MVVVIFASCVFLLPMFQWFVICAGVVALGSPLFSSLMQVSDNSIRDLCMCFYIFNVICCFSFSELLVACFVFKLI